MYPRLLQEEENIQAVSNKVKSLWRQLTSPIANNEALESEFGLEETVERIRVGGGVSAVHDVVCRHDTRGTSSYGLSKRPQVRFVSRCVVEVAGDRQLPG